MDLSFREKSILGSLIALVIVSFFYVTKVTALADTGEPIDPWALMWVAVMTVIALIVIEATYQGIIAVRSRPEAADERDRLIDSRADQIGYRVLSVGAVLAMGQAFMTTIEPSSLNGYVASPLMTVHILLGALVLAEVVSDVARLVFYRRGF